MNPKNMKVTVVGGAIGGTATALLLARAGADVTVLERVAHPRAVGAGIALAANGMAVLESLGLRPALNPWAYPIPGGRIVDGSGRALLSPAGEQPEVVVLRRSRLHAVLLDALASERRIVRHFGAEVIAATNDGEVTARTEEGEITLGADLVVGADGLHSRIREAGNFGARVSPPGIPYVRAIVGEGLARNEEAWTEAGLFGSFAVDEGTYIFASATSEGCREAVVARDLAKFRRTWERAYRPAGELLAGVGRWEDLLVNHVTRVDCDRWFDGRLALLGDAAHAMPPNLGQGANSALVDAAVLIDELRRAQDLPAALAAYQNRRRPAVTRVADSAARLGMLAELTHPAARWFRDRVLLPLAERAMSSRTEAMVLQESPATLLAIGRS